MHYTYVIKSKIVDKIYIGCTDNLKRRLQEHNLGKNISTKPYHPYDLIYCEILPTREESVKREKFYKTGRGREVLKKILFKTLKPR